MFDDRLQALVGLRDDGDALLKRARHAAAATGDPGSDPTGAVTATLDEQGRVAAVAVAEGWRSHLDDAQLGEAVVAAAQDAAMRRLTAWGDTYAQQTPSTDRAGSSFTAGWRQSLESVLAADMAGPQREAALVALLEAVEALEQGIDEVAGRLADVVSASHVGCSPRGEVVVEVTGGGDLTAVRFDRRWLRDTDDAELIRQIGAAVQAAYRLVDEHGVQRLIADSPLGTAQRAVPDPFAIVYRFGVAG